jgi:hypothetical protein
MRMAIFAAALAISGAALAQAPMEPTTVAPGNTAPERDARGIPVISDPAVAPPGFNQPPQVGGTGVPANATPAPMADNGPTPPCSRTVTDNCVQTYERGVRAGRRPRR